MKGTISISEAITEIARPEGGMDELHASAEGSYDEVHSILSLTLASELRPCTADTPPAHPQWLPKNESLKEHVGPEEATTLARDIFRHWVEKVHHAIPAGVLRGGVAER
ncbi:MAG: hypothetical protein ACO1QR_08050 [Chthoniobacteraceae bacterium]